MPQLDFVKETIAYLKFWLGVVVVSEISLVGWLLTLSTNEDVYRIVLAMFGAIALFYIILKLHRRIERFISTLEE